MSLGNRSLIKPLTTAGADNIEQQAAAQVASRGIWAHYPANG